MCVTTQVRLEWPTDLAINPLDNSLYILDNNIVLQVTKHPEKLPLIFFIYFFLFILTITSFWFQNHLTFWLKIPWNIKIFPIRLCWSSKKNNRKKYNEQNPI